MNAFNYMVLIVGLILICGFWNLIGPKERRKETLIISVSLSILSIVVYFLQSTFAPIG